MITTAIWQATLSFPPDYGRAAAMGLSLFGVMLITLDHRALRAAARHLRHHHRQGVPPARRWMSVPMRWPLLAIAWGYIVVAVILPLGALLLTSFQRFATVILPQMHFTLANYETALQMGSVGPAFVNSLILGFRVATIGVAGDRRAGLDHLPLAHAGPRRGRIRRHVPAGGAAPGVRSRPALGVDQHARSRSTARCGCWRLPTSPCFCRSACAPWPASCCRSTRAWRNARASAAPAGSIRCAP